MKSKANWDASELGKNRDAVARLAQSRDAQRMMELIQRREGAQEAVQAAAQGDASGLMSMINQLMNTKEGAELIQRIEAQAKQEGLE